MNYTRKFPFMDNLHIGGLVPAIRGEDMYLYLKNKVDSYEGLFIKKGKSTGYKKRVATIRYHEVRRVRFNSLITRLLRLSIAPGWSREKILNNYKQYIPYLTENTLVTLVWMEVTEIA